MLDSGYVRNVLNTIVLKKWNVCCCISSSLLSKILSLNFFKCLSKSWDSSVLKMAEKILPWSRSMDKSLSMFLALKLSCFPCFCTQNNCQWRNQNFSLSILDTEKQNFFSLICIWQNNGQKELLWHSTRYRDRNIFCICLFLDSKSSCGNGIALPFYFC